jgi:hypothetical protein
MSLVLYEKVKEESATEMQTLGLCCHEVKVNLDVVND